ncbi:MAG: hypothetical protein EOP87_13040 [Verrucomicrobiaceae bacterium]|nr:MAG: hypothetical protein EOP87_13040 [Verrucomicrobiaceae bacterium]
MKTISALFITFAGICGAVPPGASTSAPAFLDVNGDGVISESERQAYEEARANARVSGGEKWDSNHDGTVDEGERQAAVAILKGRMDSKVASLFLDLAGEDEMLTLDEFATLPRFAKTPPQVAGNLFNRLDVDQDGYVSLVEFFKGTGRGNPPANAGRPK